MECPYCYTNFEYRLSICPHCAKATDDPLYQELFSRVKPRKIEEKAPEAEQTPAALAAAAAMGTAAEPPPAAEVLPREIRERPAVTAEIKIKDTSSTLVDFPGKKAELPEWRLELQARLREIQDQRGGSAETSATTEALTAKKHAIGGTGLAMAVLETPETPAHPLMQKALERIERSRLNNEKNGSQVPVNNYQEPYRPSYAPVYTPPVYHKPVVAAEPEPPNGIRPFIHSENETVESRLSMIGQNHAEKLAQATEIKNDLIKNDPVAGEKFSTNKLRMLEQAVSYTNGGGAGRGRRSQVRGS